MHTAAPEGFGMKKSLLAASAAFFLGGCLTFLPSGKAPEGKITDNNTIQQGSLSQDELEAQAATSLCAYMMLNSPAMEINAVDQPSARVLKSVAGVIGIQNRTSAVLRLEMKDGVFRLVSGKDTLLWQYPEK